MEEWKAIKEYPDYMASNTGKIKSLKRKNEIILKPATTRKGKGYYMIILCKHGGIKYFLIHRLIAECFIPNPENKPQVNHIDGNKKNNFVENLEWCTSSENIKHTYDILHRKPNSPNINRKGILSTKYIKINQIDIKTGKIINTFYGSCEAARSINIKNGHIAIGRCCLGKQKVAYGYKWEHC